MDTKATKQTTDNAQANIAKKVEEEVPEQFATEAHIDAGSLQHGTPPSANNIISLQRLIGNHSVQRLLQDSAPIQQKSNQAPDLGFLPAPNGFVQRLQRGQPPYRNLRLNIDHIINGELKGGGRMVGFHSILGKTDRTRNVTPYRGANRNSVYKATVSIEDASKFSTMYPDNWSQAKIVESIQLAYNNATVWDGSYFEGEGNGIRIGGYVNGRSLNTAFPIA